MNTATDMLPGPLHPDLFEPDPTPSVLPVEKSEPRWRAEILQTHDLWIMGFFWQPEYLEQLRQQIEELVERSGAERWEILGSSAQHGCCPYTIVQVGLVHHVELVADTSHTALEIAQAVAGKRWSASEVIGVDLVLPEPEEDKE